MFYVLSLRLSAGTNWVWWGPEGRGYTQFLGLAGLYTSEDVRTNAAKLNNGKTAIAIPYEEVWSRVSLVVPRSAACEKQFLEVAASIKILEPKKKKARQDGGRDFAGGSPNERYSGASCAGHPVQQNSHP
jgi:hypothetical protein